MNQADTFSRMLVCMGGGFTAVRYAARLAAVSGATLTIAEVIDESHAIIRPVRGRGWDVPVLAREQALTRLKRAALRAQRTGVTPQTRLLVGRPVETLAREVTRGRHDLLVISAAGREPRGIGSTTARVVRECPCPVLVVRPRPSRRHPRVLVAIDIGRGISLAAINARLFDAALWFVRHTGADLHVLHVWDAVAIGVMRRAGATRGNIRRHLAEVQADRARELQSAVSPYRRYLTGARIHLVRGDARAVIPAFARSRDVDLVVLGTVGRRGLARWIMGNTAEAVLATLRRSVLAVRPAR